MLYHSAVFDELIDPCYYLVEDYLSRKELAKIGITQSFDDLDLFEVQYLTIIGHELTELEAKNVKNRNISRH
jgi:hypothetical protein